MHWVGVRICNAPTGVRRRAHFLTQRHRPSHELDDQSGCWMDEVTPCPWGETKFRHDRGQFPARSGCDEVDVVGLVPVLRVDGDCTTARQYRRNTGLRQRLGNLRGHIPDAGTSGDAHQPGLPARRGRRRPSAKGRRCSAGRFSRTTWSNCRSGGTKMLRGFQAYTRVRPSS